MGYRRSSKRLYAIVGISVAVVILAIVLFAVFFVPKYKTISFEMSDIPDWRVKQGSVIGELPHLQQEGYLFDGWYYSDQFTEDTKVNVGVDIVTEDIKLYPKLDRQSYTISYNINGGVGNTPEPITNLFKELIVLPRAGVVGFEKIDPVYGALELRYWTTNADGTGEKYEPGTTIRVPSKNITLYAFWDRKRSTLYFCPNKGEYVADVELYVGEPVPERERNPFCQRYGYTRSDYWYFNEECLGNPIDFTTFIMPEDDVYLYAKWEAIPVKIKFHLSYSDYVNQVEPYAEITSHYDGYITPPEKPTKPGEYFKFWAVGIDGVTSEFNFDRKIDSIKTIHLFASWTNEITPDIEDGADCFVYTESNNKVTITGLTEKGNQLTNLVIPRKIGLMDVIAIDGISSNDKLVSVTLPHTIESISATSFSNCPNIKEFAFAGPNDVYKVEDGVIFSKDGTILHHYPSGKDVETYNVPADVVTIAQNAFSYASVVQNVSFNAVTVDTNAFNHASSITTLTFGSKVRNINKNAFINLDNLQFIEIENNSNFVVENGILYQTTLQDGDVRVKTRLIKCFNKNENLNLVIPEGVVSIDAFAFNKCSNIISLEFAESVTEFGEYCLYKLENLQTLTFNTQAAEGIIGAPSLLIEPGQISTIYAYENSFVWTALNKIDFCSEKLVAL